MGSTTTCDATGPMPYTNTVGTGPGNDGRTVILQDGARIAVTNRPAISLGDDALIALESGSAVHGGESGGGGNYGTGPNVIEFNSFGTLHTEAGATLEARCLKRQARILLPRPSTSMASGTSSRTTG